MTDVAVINTGIYRDNLHYEVEPVQDEAERQRLVAETVRDTAGSGIVFTATVKQAEHVTAVYDAVERLDTPTGPAPLDAVQSEAAGVAKSKVRVVLSLLGARPADGE